MKVQSIRFSDNAWALITEEAARQGVSASQYVREAALTRVAFDAGRRSETANVIQSVFDVIRKLDAAREDISTIDNFGPVVEND